MLDHEGQVEVVSSLERDGRAIPCDMRWGVYVMFEGDTEYIRRCFEEYGLRTDPSGRYACLYKPLAPDRPRARHLGGVGRAARRADRLRRPAGAPTSSRPPSAT